jgi:hypothetical protein
LGINIQMCEWRVLILKGASDSQLRLTLPWFKHRPSPAGTVQSHWGIWLGRVITNTKVPLFPKMCGSLGDRTGSPVNKTILLQRCSNISSSLQ